LSSFKPKLAAHVNKFSKTSNTKFKENLSSVSSVFKQIDEQMDRTIGASFNLLLRTRQKQEMNFVQETEL